MGQNEQQTTSTNSAVAAANFLNLSSTPDRKLTINDGVRDEDDDDHSRDESLASNDSGSFGCEFGQEEEEGFRYLEPFTHQVGGHNIVLSLDHVTVCKPYSVREYKFYETVSERFRPFVPEYRGVVEVELMKHKSVEKLPTFAGSVYQQNTPLEAIESSASSPCLFSNSDSIKYRNSLPNCPFGRIRLKRSGLFDSNNTAARPRSAKIVIFDDTISLLDKRQRPKTTTKGRYSPSSRFCDETTSNSSILPFCGQQSSNVVNNGSCKKQQERSLFYARNPWALQCQSRQLTKLQEKNVEKQKFLMLENLVHDFNLPCVLDLKMGFRQHGDDALQSKIYSQSLKCENSTSAKLGVRMCGMQVYQIDTDVFKCHNKYKGRTLSIEGFEQEICNFWYNGQTFRFDLLPLCISKLKRLKDLVFAAEGYRFYSSSLLIIYEGDPTYCSQSFLTTSEQRMLNNNHHVTSDFENLVDVRMIDFEHSSWPLTRDIIGAETAASQQQPTTQQQQHIGPHDGYVQGVTNLIDVWQRFLASTQ